MSDEIPTTVTFVVAGDDNLSATVDLADAGDRGWGISRVEIVSGSWPVRHEHLVHFMTVTGQLIVDGGVAELVARHEGRGR